MIKMGQLLHLDIVAEGVETIEEVKFLAEHHCHHLQGYYFGKPVRANEFEQVFLKRT